MSAFCSILSYKIHSIMCMYCLSRQWPFVRVWGVQEPASAAFSILNGLSNLWGYQQFVRSSSPAYPHHRLLRAQLGVSMSGQGGLMHALIEPVASQHCEDSCCSQSTTSGCLHFSCLRRSIWWHGSGLRCFMPGTRTGRRNSTTSVLQRSLWLVSLPSLSGKVAGRPENTCQSTSDHLTG